MIIICSVTKREISIGEWSQRFQRRERQTAKSEYQATRRYSGIKVSFYNLRKTLYLLVALPVASGGAALSALDSSNLG